MAISDLTLLSTYAIGLGICMVREDKQPILDAPTVLDKACLLEHVDDALVDIPRTSSHFACCVLYITARSVLIFSCGDSS